ncbi:hypothetical protein DXG03_007157 [Asterophora parasitica]|uniref:RNA-directed RNA polymerase n=1 Tax=Asterophora parasitica TaxID=117018 RepID=A0A9P7GD82_9AGAR|nr:hypothetical protein DXG03_007157 [Asterophora parasitica]
MNLKIQFLPYDVNEWTVTRKIATILHSDEFAPRQRDEHAVDRPINFRVKLNPSKAGGVGNDGTGVLTLPTNEIGLKFLDWVKDGPLRVEGKKVKFFRVGHPPRGLALTLDKTPYINPDIEEEQQQKMWDLRDQFRVDAVQFGVFYRPKYPSTPQERLTSRAFSVEWERKYTVDSIGWLSFEYDHKIIRISLGNDMTDKVGSTIAINFTSIQKIAVGYDGNPYICFDTLMPPVLEEIEFHRTLTGDDKRDNRKFKKRIGSLHPGHQVVAPYAQHLRILIYNDPKIDTVLKFTRMCRIAGLAENMIIHCTGPNNVYTDRQGFFTPKRLYRLGLEFKRLPWAIAFQLESLLLNGLLHTGDLEALFPQVRALCDSQGPKYVADLLRQYHEKLEIRPIRESPIGCFTRINREFTFSDSTLPAGTFHCSHVTFTPTRMILEGPYATQSNRVIRMYTDYLDHFIRVDFRDEDKLQYRWDREVDGSTYLQERVGGILKNGFELAGRYFEFLAYSSSALREHAVWFVSPFRHKETGIVIDSEYIRRTLGDFEGTDLLKEPSKFAARLAQAFTATDPSVGIHRGEWEETPDLGEKPYEHTDGVGTISKALGVRIWAALCAGRGDRGKNSVQPSAYQIRFLGYKGVVAVDEQLDKRSDGIHMRLRPSMRKFQVSQAEMADIEIAQSFEHPNTCYLNRPLIMILEDLGVRLDSFVRLQEDAVADARTINDSCSQFRSILDNHSLGRPYRLSRLLQRIELLGLDLNPLNRNSGFDNPFLRQVRQVSMLDVLRDIKHSARIPIPESYLLVGVADEGPAYREAGFNNVYALPEGHIFACIQRSLDEEPKWLEGSCSISRSPVVHPGDVQRVRAIGKPPAGMLCLFGHMKNVVVLPSVGLGKRSLASQLGGGDVDGDTFAIICYEPLLPSDTDEPASYLSAGTFTIDRESTVEDICNFVVEYIHSDVLGLLSDRLLVIADQSKDGMRDESCLMLAQLCSQAVDYPKQGIPVDIDNELPRTLIRCKPDWHAAEVVSPRHTDYYESNRALGVLFRSITLDDPKPISIDSNPEQQSPQDSISLCLKTPVERHLGPTPEVADVSQNISKIFRSYVDELQYISATHTISNTPGVRLLEAEIVAGTILAKCSQKRYRQDRMYRMRLHASTLARDVQRELIEDVHGASQEELVIGIRNAWEAWGYSKRLNYAFGASSFGLIALGVIFDCLDNHPKEEEESGPEDEELPRRLAFRDAAGKPIAFFIHKNVANWTRDNLTTNIRKHGGIVQSTDRNVDTVIVDTSRVDKDAIQRVYNADISDDQCFRDTWVEPLSFIKRCIKEGQVRHLLPGRKRMGGTIGGRHDFTKEDDDHLARYIAAKVPHKEEGGRRGDVIYQELEELSWTDDLFAWARHHTWQSWRNRYNKNMERLDPMIAKYVNKWKPTEKQRHVLIRQPARESGRKRAYSNEQSGDSEEIEEEKHEFAPSAKKRRLSGFSSRSPLERARIPQEASAVEDIHYRYAHTCIFPRTPSDLHCRSLFGDSEDDEPGPSTRRRAPPVAHTKHPALHSSPPPPFSTLPQNLAEGSPQLAPQQRTSPAAPATVANDAPHVRRTSGGSHSPPADSQHKSTSAAVAPQIFPAPLRQRQRAIKRPGRPAHQPVAPIASPHMPPYRNMRSRSRSVEPSVVPSRPQPSKWKGKEKVIVIEDSPVLAPLEEGPDEEDDMPIMSLEESVSLLRPAGETQEEELDVEELLVNSISAPTTHVSDSEEAQDRVAFRSRSPASSSSSGLSGIGTPPLDNYDDNVPVDPDDAQTHQALQHPPTTAPAASQRPTSIFNSDEDKEMLRNFMARLPQPTARVSNVSGLRPTPAPFSRTHLLANEAARRPRHSVPARPSHGDPFQTALTPRSAGPDVWIQSEAAQARQVQMARRGSVTSIASVESFPVAGTKASAVKKRLEAEEKRTPYRPPTGTRAAGFRQPQFFDS